MRCAQGKGKVCLLSFLGQSAGPRLEFAYTGHMNRGVPMGSCVFRSTIEVFYTQSSHYQLHQKLMDERSLTHGVSGMMGDQVDVEVDYITCFVYSGVGYIILVLW